MTDPAQHERLVDVYADVSCPFAHFSLRRFSERRRHAGAEHVRLRVHAGPLELANGEPLAAGKVADEIVDLRAQVAGDLFTGFDQAAFPSTTLALLATATLAYQHDADIGEAFNLAIRDALFEQGRAIGEPDVLAEIAARFDLEVPDPAAARAAVNADFAEGQRRASPAPPTSSWTTPRSSAPPSTSNAKASTSASTSTTQSSTGSSIEHSNDGIAPGPRTARR